MKNLSYLLLLTVSVFGFQNFTLPTTEVSEIMQTIVELEAMEQIWAKNEAGNILPVYLVGRQQFPETPEFNIADHPVKLVSAEEISDLGEDIPHMNITEFKIKKGKKARLQFTYDGIRVKVTMRKEDGNWTNTQLSIVGRGIIHKSLDWSL